MVRNCMMGCAMRGFFVAAAVMVGIVSSLAVSALATSDPQAFTLTIKDHRFTPDVMEVPANRRFTLLVHNADPTPEEFESYELNREKVVPGGATVKIFVGPLAPGVYPFFGDFNQKTAQGRLIAK